MVTFPAITTRLANNLVAKCRSNNITITTCESCTGGSLAAVITSIPGASEVFGYGFVTYANDAKTAMVDVNSQLIAKYGAVSPQVAASMVTGALSRAKATIGVAITGIAGPGGGSVDKPVGLVWFGAGYIKNSNSDQAVIETDRQMFGYNDRSVIINNSVNHALKLLLARANKI